MAEPLPLPSTGGIWYRAGCESDGEGARRTISTGFSATERTRFHNLLKLAAESPYEGERRNALDAAHRLAARHDMTVEEAARGDEPRERAVPPRDHAADTRAAAFARFFHLSEVHLRADKQRHQEALRRARARGLDGEAAGVEDPPPRPGSAPRRPSSFRSRRRLDRFSFARILIRETGLSLHEIATITDLTIYEVVGLKLKMRQAA